MPSNYPAGVSNADFIREECYCPICRTWHDAPPCRTDQVIEGPSPQEIERWQLEGIW